MATASKILQTVEEQDVQFVALWFTDITGLVKEHHDTSRRIGECL